MLIKITEAMIQNWTHCLLIVMVRLNQKNFKWKLKPISRRSHSSFFDHLKKSRHHLRPIVLLFHQLKAIGSKLSAKLLVQQNTCHARSKSFGLIGNQDTPAVRGKQSFGPFDVETTGVPGPSLRVF